MTVVVVGASDNPERYSYRALMLLKEEGHQVIPVHPKLEAIEGIAVTHSLKDIKVAVDTVSLYVGPDRSKDMTDDLLALRPRRVIFNPGAENESLEEVLSAARIQTIRACTIVLLETGQF